MGIEAIIATLLRTAGGWRRGTFSVSSIGICWLFGGLFIVTAALAATGQPADALAALTAAGIDPKGLAVMALSLLVGSNTIGNVPTAIPVSTITCRRIRISAS